ncbi:type II secretion system protein [Enterobacter cloacae]|uniref:type II secretion system protein n=1 Tax=Enterobacter cloacae TaxID=550 RepID=UPI003DA12A92
MRALNRASGFSLLEIIVVLAIAGSALVAYTNYARKQAAKEMRQNIANALVHEMNGVMNFLRDGTLQTKDGEKANPFYESVNTPSEAHYHYRITNGITDIDTGTATNYFLWGDGANPQNQQRYYFISKGCKVTLKSTYELTNEYLPCSLMSSASNPAAEIERIGFATDDLQKESNTVDRMDVIVAFSFTQGSDKYSFANYLSPFNNALNRVGLNASHIMIVHRGAAADAWKLVTKADGSTPVELADIASNLERLEKLGNGQQLGIRFTFEIRDNDSGGSGGGGSKCWNTSQSKIELCYNQKSGTGMHGEDQILSLDMFDRDKKGDETRTGTLKANLVMENTGRPVYIFKRSYGGDLLLSANGEPEHFTYKDGNGEAFEGEFYLDDNTGHRSWNGNSMSGSDITSEYYTPEVYDAFELVTPSVTEYSGFERLC